MDPDDFYILASKEAVCVPPDHAAEMRAYDTLVGEFRVHYAGFFDPGFGYAAAGGGGSRAVLEVRSHDVPFLLEDGQVVGRLIYERLTQPPDQLYGAAIGSNYQEFRRRALADVPLGEILEPAEIADLIYFLTSDSARNITGQAYNICGGQVMH